MNSIIQFSVGANSIYFEVNHQQIVIPQGLTWIATHSINAMVLNSLTIETMIYIIEELLEKLPISYADPKIAMTDDAWMKQLSGMFFQSEQRIDRIWLERAFNDFIQHIEYYVKQVQPDNIALLIYFVFIREMMHHLNVEVVQIV